ncbi:MAG: hypothetical protein FJW76_01545 [Actinobacteria bacterium]|nr:hypothetical protein [Actinomycetota bacterium]
MPKTSWSAPALWALTPKRLLILLFGLTLMGIGGSLLVQSELGNPPWTVLAQGLSVQLGIPLGWAFFIVSCLVLLVWIPLKVMPGFGTIANAVWFAVVLQIGTSVLPKPTELGYDFAFAIVGILLIGFGTAVYISCGLGPGPRDGWMLGLVKRTGIQIWKIRFSIEAFALLIGFLLGGKVGVGTVLVVLLIGQIIAISFTLLSRLPGEEKRELMPEV